MRHLWVVFLWWGLASAWASDENMGPQPFANPPPPTFEAEPASGLYLGGGVKLGQSRSTVKKSPQPSYGLSAELGYLKALGRWSRLEPSLEIYSHTLGYGKVDVDAPLNAIAQIGYGYSLGSKLFALWKIGAGAGLAKVSDESTGISLKSNSLMGTLIRGAFLMDVPMRADLSVTSGLQWTHYAYHVDELKSGSLTIPWDQPLNLNTYELHLGIRFLFL